jgi:hypothetical protein
VTGPAGVALCDGDGLGEAVAEGDVEAVGEADRNADADADAGTDRDPDGEGDAVDVTLGERATATGRGVDSRQAASASKPSNAGPATPSYRIPRPYPVAIPPSSPAVEHGD